MKKEETLGKYHNLRLLEHYPDTEIDKVYIFFKSNGDSGGPLIKQNVPGSTPYNLLVGLVSFGPKNCGTKNQPGKKFY